MKKVIRADTGNFIAETNILHKIEKAHEDGKTLLNVDGTLVRIVDQKIIDGEEIIYIRVKDKHVEDKKIENKEKKL